MKLNFKLLYVEVALAMLLSVNLHHIGYQFDSPIYWIYQIICGVAICMVCDEIFQDDNEKKQ